MKRGFLALLFAVISVIVGQGFALLPAATCAQQNPFGEFPGADCTQRYVFIVLTFAGAVLGWILVVGLLRVVASRITGLAGERHLWAGLGWLCIAAIIFVSERLPFREVLLIAAIPGFVIGIQETAWRFEPSIGPRKPLIAGLGWALVGGASAYLVTAALVQWSPTLSRIWWGAVRFGHPGDTLAGPAFLGAAVVTLLVYLLKPSTGLRAPPDSQALLVVLAGAAVFGFSVPVWIWSALENLPEDPIAEWVATAFQNPSTLVSIGGVAGLSALVGALAAFQRSRAETWSLLVIGAPIISVATVRFAREWLAISGDYPFTGEIPHFTGIGLFAVSHVLWVYPLLGYFLAVRARRPVWTARWTPSITGLSLAALIIASLWLSFQTETSQRFQFFIDSFRLKEDLPLLAVPLLATGWLLPALPFPAQSHRQETGKTTPAQPDESGNRYPPPSSADS